MKKTFLSLSALLLALAIISACSQSKPSDDEASAAKAPPTGELVITATDWKFDQQEYRVKQGETLTVKVNSVKGAHGVKIDKIGEIGPNKSKDITFDKPGTYQILCSILCGAGHSTMKATLIVE